MLKVSQLHSEKSVTCTLKVWTVPYIIANFFIWEFTAKVLRPQKLE